MADLEALAAVGARGWAVATALTAQGPRGARAVVPVAPAMLLAQVDALLDGAPGASTGGEDRHAGERRERGGAGGAARPASPSGGFPWSSIRCSSRRPASPFSTPPTPARRSHALLARATLVTPNWPELEALTGHALASEEEAIRAARELPSRAVLVKGGHRTGQPVDLLVRGRTVARIRGRRRPVEARGTGCRLASATAGFLARGLPLEEAVRRAKRVVERYLDAALRGA